MSSIGRLDGSKKPMHFGSQLPVNKKWFGAKHSKVVG
jgi:hypothetical protein